MKHLQVNFDSIDDDSTWITGSIGNGKYEFYAKVEDEKSKFGVEKGRVTKLTIRQGSCQENVTEDEFWKQVVVNYDRDWQTKPINQEANEIFYVILDLLEKVPIYEERIYGGSKAKKILSKAKSVVNSISGTFKDKKSASE